MSDASFPLTESVYKKILTPLGENKVGAFLKYETVYDEILQARLEEDETHSQGVWKRTVKKADWEKIKDLCLNALMTQTKDLQIAAWLVEAWLKLYSFQGLQEGLKVIGGLIEVFWQDLYPPLEEDDEYRLSPLNWLNEKMPEKIRLIPLTASRDQLLANFNYGDLEAANRLQDLFKMGARGAELAQREIREGKPTKEKFDASQSLTPVAFYQDLSESVQKALVEIEKTEMLLQQKHPSKEKAFYKITNCLKDIEHFVKKALKAAPQSSVEDEKSQASLADAPSDSMSEKSQTEKGYSPLSLEDIQITTREEAYQLLSKAAEFLKANEPHNPTPYLVERAVAWGQMSFTEFLNDAARSEGNLTKISQLLGVDEDQGDPHKKENQ
jgi:type VI secretion system ImpA family protein